MLKSVEGLVGVYVAAEQISCGVHLLLSCAVLQQALSLGPMLARLGRAHLYSGSPTVAVSVRLHPLAGSWDGALQQAKACTASEMNHPIVDERSATPGMDMMAFVSEKDVQDGLTLLRTSLGLPGMRWPKQGVALQKSVPTSAMRLARASAIMFTLMDDS